MFAVIVFGCEVLFIMILFETGDHCMKAIIKSHIHPATRTFEQEQETQRNVQAITSNTEVDADKSISYQNIAQQFVQ